MTAEKVEALRKDRQARGSLYVQSLPWRKNIPQKKKWQAAYSSALWRHPLPVSFFNAAVKPELVSKEAFYKDLQAIASLLRQASGGELGAGVFEAFGAALRRLVDLSRAEAKQRLQGMAHQGLQGNERGGGQESAVSEWERAEREADQLLEALPRATQSVLDGEPKVTSLIDLRSKGMTYVAVADEGGGTYRVAMIALGRQAHAYHLHRPSGTELRFNAVLELRGVPEARLRSRVFWTLALLVETRHFYSALLPWLLHRPLEDIVAAAAREEANSPRDFWQPLPSAADASDERDITTGLFVDAAAASLLLAVVRYLMACACSSSDSPGGLGAAVVNDF